MLYKSGDTWKSVLWGFVADVILCSPDFSELHQLCWSLACNSSAPERSSYDIGRKTYNSSDLLAEEDDAEDICRRLQIAE